MLQNKSQNDSRKDKNSDTDWKTYYLGTSIIDVPIQRLDKLALDNWAHQLIKDHDMTKNQYFNVTVIMRQALHDAVDLGIIQTLSVRGVIKDAGMARRETVWLLVLGGVVSVWFLPSHRNIG